MKILTINDFDTVQPYIEKANYKGYNSNFVTLMMWNHEYHIQYDIVDDILMMLLEFDNHQFFSMPFCIKDKIPQAIEWMKVYAHDHHIEFRIECVTKDIRDYIQSLYKDDFSYVQHLGYSDYIYDLSTLVSLKGKKMQKRRNHYNYFLKQYNNFVFKEIEVDDFYNIYQCLEQWSTLHQDDEMVNSEFIGISYLLNNLEKLPVKTGCIYLDGKLEAFTIGSLLPHSTVQIHVEKANKDIRGLYVAINKLFLEYHYSDYLYVNREEDMGIESLRKAKQSLHPIDMIDKYRIFYNQYIIEENEDAYKDQLIELWKNNFDDEDDESTEYFFSYHYPINDCFVMTYHQQVISCVFVHQYNTEAGLVNYVVGVATKIEHQHNHCMKHLLQHVMQLEKFKDYPFYLMTDKPFVYESLGFQELYYKNKLLINTFDDSVCTLDNHKASCYEMLDLYNQVMTNFSGYRIRDIDYYELFLIRAVAYKQVVLCYYQDDKLVGYLLYSIQNEIVIDEIICLNSNIFKQMIQSFKGFNKSIIVYCDITNDVNFNYKRVCVMYSNLNILNSKNPLFISEIM
ncbi:GNAT family N-acetyltransferase [Tannockella kyphosi]|uniref:GNAT family N-acetyltransferase n=1 Tax=Tannockella kyphosi TaxID=2899121 RepID=UPI0020111A16|nr:GNAT family N-acetyltransferase [Tannockella kyphosi]